MESKSKKQSNTIFTCPFEGCTSSYKRIFRLNRHIRAHKAEVCQTRVNVII